jgi:hypothetical protein
MYTGTEFSAHELICAPDGSSVAILDKGQFCMLYETDEGSSAAAEQSARWEADEGLTHVSEEEEEWEAGQASFLSSHLEQVLA